MERLSRRWRRAEFKAVDEAQLSRARAKTKQAAVTGRLERCKTSNVFDGTARIRSGWVGWRGPAANPSWARPRRPDHRVRRSQSHLSNDKGQLRKLRECLPERRRHRRLDEADKTAVASSDTAVHRPLDRGRMPMNTSPARDTSRATALTKEKSSATAGHLILPEVRRRRAAQAENAARPPGGPRAGRSLRCISPRGVAPSPVDFASWSARICSARSFTNGRTSAARRSNPAAASIAAINPNRACRCLMSCSFQRKCS